jgi:prepilin-type N-terminal cleavage/methylation domain-containing protein
MRSGFTLSEMMLVVALIGILVGIGIPPLSRALDRVEVASAVSHIVAAHTRARLMAVTRSRVMTLAVDSLALTIRERGFSEPLWSEGGPTLNGVSLAGPSRSFTFSPEGFSLGLSNATLVLQRGASTRTVVVSRLGRIRVH